MKRSLATGVCIPDAGPGTPGRPVGRVANGSGEGVLVPGVGEKVSNRESNSPNPLNAVVRANDRAAQPPRYVASRRTAVVFGLKQRRLLTRRTVRSPPDPPSTIVLRTIPQNWPGPKAPSSGS